MNNDKKSKKQKRNKNKREKKEKEEKKENQEKDELGLIQEKEENNIGSENENENNNEILEEEVNINKLTDEKKQKLKEIDFQREILRNINEDTLNLKIGKKIKFTDSIFKENNYILTNEMKEKLSQLYIYMKNQIPCILEGETGTSKTFSSIILSKYLAKNWKKENLHQNFKLIRFNLSSESKVSDLMGKYTGAKNSFAGINFQPGPFMTAFKEGHCLLLDEINLANPTLLQCIEEALDTKILSIEVPGLPIEPIPMHKNFCLIATQNPNKGHFTRKRNELKKEFLSRFQIITFNEFTQKELFEICKGMMKGNEFDKNKDVINDLIKFHLKWIQEPDVKNDIKYFTIREISLFIEALTDENNKLTPHELILIIYGSKYPEKELYRLKNILKNFSSLDDYKMDDIFNNSNINDNKNKKKVDSKNVFDKFGIIKNEDDNEDKDKDENIEEEKITFKNCFQNNSLTRSIHSIRFAFKYGKNVLILGKKGVGKTQLALWISEYFDKKIIFY